MAHARRASRGTLLLEALVALSLLGIVLIFGTQFFVRRRGLEKARMDREVALRALQSEWVYCRTAPPGSLAPGKDAPFLGSETYLRSVARRTPAMTVKEADLPGLLFIRLEIGYGTEVPRRMAQEGYVRAGGGP